MINIPASLNKGIGQLAGLLNQFKSEAVQVKLLDRFLSGVGSVVQPVTSAISGNESPAVAPKRRGRPPGSGKKKAGRPAVVAVAVATPKPAKAGRRKRSKMGATGALHKLIDSGFFKARRSIAEVTAACKNKLGLDIAVTNLSGPLMRFVSEKKLVRAKNKDDKYEYWAK
jgi:hypothetical protein